MSEHNERRDYEREQAVRTEPLADEHDRDARRPALDWIAECEPKFHALYTNLGTDELQRRLRFHDEIATDRRAPAFVRESSLTAFRLITKELMARQLVSTAAD